MATDRKVSLTSNQPSEVNSIAQSRTLLAGYLFRAKLILMLAEGALQHHEAYAADQCSHHHPLEATLPRVRTRWARYL